ncbi:MAG: winged helix-turn-helix transcriptional regulator [Muribaculaceae bacterium]|nr:winged helix-turn-helix transcriptional regulator [Muribaculaceae bacterium]
MKEEVPNKVPNKSELSVLRLLADNPRLTRGELAEKVGMTENGIKKIVANMKAAGWIERIGSNKTGYWLVKQLATLQANIKEY